MSTIFSKIIDGEIPCYKIAENEEFLAFLDVNPLQPGHTLVVPKKEVDYIFDLEDDLLARMTVFAKRVAGSIKRAVDCNRVAVVVLGLEVPHAHIHLVPVKKESDVDFKNKLILSAEEMEDIQQKITAS